MAELVLVHGRSQQERIADALKAEWLTALTDGLAKSGLTLPIPESAVHFAYYGQTLFDLVAGKTPDQAATVIIRGENAQPREREFADSIINEICNQLGITDAEIAALLGTNVVQRGPLNWAWVQGALKAIDRRIPYASSTSLALFTNDVYHYLNNPGITKAINDGVRQAITPGVPTVVVAHSLGTVVAYSLLRDEGAQAGWDVRLYVTLGSPLGISAIKQKLAPNKHPSCAKRWFNAMDERDVVALYPLTKRHFPVNPGIENKTDVKNHTENRHGIGGYLDDPVIAKTIHDALTA